MSDHYEKTGLGRVLQALSQLGNALAGGQADVSISARIGQKRKRNGYWRFANDLVDFAFFPVDGRDHCYNAWQKDKDESYIATGNFLTFGILTLLFTGVCLLLIPITWTVGWLYAWIVG